MAALGGAKASLHMPGQTSPEGKRTKQKLSCAECRRLKLKCDRDVPCSNCIRRNCHELCPDGTKATRRSVMDAKTIDTLQKRLSKLENFVSDQGYEIDDDHCIQLRHFINQDSTSSAALYACPNSLPSNSLQSRRELLYAGSHRSLRDSSTSPHYSASNRRSRSPSHRISDHDRRASRFSYDSPSTSSVQVSMMSSVLSHQPPLVSGQGLSINQNEGSNREGGMQLPPISSFGHMPSDTPIEQSHGTLVLGKSGRSRYLGPTAGTEWLKNQEVAGLETPSHSPINTASIPLPMSKTNDAFYSFPFHETRPIELEVLFGRLPPKPDAEVLVDSYYRYFAWNHDPAPKRTFEPIFNRVYSSPHPSPNGSSWPERSVQLQQLALVYMILAMGTVHNIELPPHDPSAEEYIGLAKACLTRANFMGYGSVAGAQTLVTMAHYLLETESGRNGDAAWPLWGLAMSLIVAMGLHRDGARWNLPEDVIQERRQVFWECHTIQVFQANCFSRPNSLVPRYIDTAFPSPNSTEVEMGGKGWPTLKYELCQISSKILDVGMTVQLQSYSTVQSLYSELCAFESNIPYALRCRSALLALPSVYPDPEIAQQNCPEVSRHNLHRTLQQFTLALNISENVLFLQRPYFVMAMHDEPADPVRSVYGHSYLAVVERCDVIIQVVSDLYKLHPTIISRQWFFWYHLFTAAVCLGTLILKTPQFSLSPFALSRISQAVQVYSTLIKQNSSLSMVQNHDWLLRLQQRAATKMTQAVSSGTSETLAVDCQGQDEDDRELLGWKTRLIERAASSDSTAINIASTYSFHPKQSPISGLAGMVRATDLLQQHFIPTGAEAEVGTLENKVNDMFGTGSENLGLDSSTDEMLHQFWDPMMMTDGGNNITNENWWSWDFGLPENGS
nr:hypothetical protein L203_04409 [Cryptococcus depauperatus CBS 7841]